MARAWPARRGLRVRIGMHTGVHFASEVRHNAASARTVYSGEALATAKAVADMAPGGMIFMSSSTYEYLHGSHAMPSTCAFSHTVTVELPASHVRHVYCMLTLNSAPLLALLPPPRLPPSALLLEGLGLHRAPVGTTATAALMVRCVSHGRAWPRMAAHMSRGTIRPRQGACM